MDEPLAPREGKSGTHLLQKTGFEWSEPDSADARHYSRFGRRPAADTSRELVRRVVIGVLWYSPVGMVSFLVLVISGPTYWQLLHAENRGLGLVGATLLTVCVSLVVWSYLRTMFTEGQPIPHHFLGENNADLFTPASMETPAALRQADQIFLQRHKLYERKADGGARYCRRCDLFKPDRAHHCSMCGRCVLKMDHHCPWVCNCVHYHNYRYFLQFLFWDVVGAAYAAAVLALRLYVLMKRSEDGDSSAVGRNLAEMMPIMMSLVVALGFSISLGLFLGFHLSLVFRNATTLEQLDYPKSPYTRGWRQNFLDVLGPSPLGWFLPLYPAAPPNAGAAFPVRPDLRASELV